MSFAIVALSCVLIAQDPKASAPDTDLLRNWFEAVTAHKPGVIDDPLLAVARWPGADLQRLQVEAGILFLLIENPNLQRIRYTPPDTGMYFSVDPRRPQSMVFDGARLERIRLTAQLVRAAGVETTLKRSVVFHTDIMTLRLDVGPTPDAPGRSAARVHVDDGRFAGVSQSPIHWEIARALVARIAASPDADKWVCEWFRASTAFLIGDREYSEWHLRAALNRFPADAPLLMLAGAQHEAFAGPMVQAFLRDRTDGGNLKVPVDSAERELSEAQKLFERALSSDPSLVEARVRLGRVMGLRGRHADAVGQLRIAAPSASEPLVAYFAHLFLGGELLEVGDAASARESFTRAAGLYPNARSVNLSLADLAWRSGQQAEIEAHLLRAIPARSVKDDDPWSRYYPGAGRNAAQMLDALRAAIGSSSGGRF